MKTPTLLLHGALGAASQFDSFIRVSSPEQPLFPVTFPGHGASPATEPYSMASFAAAVLQFMDDHHITSANIFGYSMGGYVALHLAAEYPERVRQVVTYGTKLHWSPDVAAGMNRMFDPEKIAAKVPQFAASLAATHADWPAVCLRTSAFLEVLGRGGGIQEGAFARITCPVTIGWGAEDQVVSEAESRAVAALIPQGKFVALNGARHQIELVDPEFLFKFVEEALQPTPE